jgi:hypothetical protein
MNHNRTQTTQFQLVYTLVSVGTAEPVVTGDGLDGGYIPSRRKNLPPLYQWYSTGGTYIIQYV